MADDIRQAVGYLWREHRGKSVGILLGMILAVSILVIGFFRTLFIVLFMAAGLYVGKKIDGGEGDDLLRSVENSYYGIKRRVKVLFGSM